LLCHRAKNLYNEANFYFRQFFFRLGELVTYYDLQFALKNTACYKALPAQTAQQTLKLVIQNWASYFAARQEYRHDPGKFLGCPRPPKHKARDGECVAVFTNQNARVKGGYLHFPEKCHLKPVKTRVGAFRQVRIVPKECGYTCEVIYDRLACDLHLDQRRAIGIDLGLRNLVTAANNIGLAPFVVKGGAAKSVNQFYNKQNAAMQSKKDLLKQDFQTKWQRKLLQWRNNRMRDLFHKVSRKIIAYCIARDIGTIAIGYNPQ
jgi:putative transposase